MAVCAYLLLRLHRCADSRKHTQRLQEPPPLEDSTSRSTPSSPARVQAFQTCEHSAAGHVSTRVMRSEVTHNIIFAQNVLWATVIGRCSVPLIGRGSRIF